LAGGLNTRFTEIGPGNFSAKVNFSKGGYKGNASDLPPGDIVVSIINTMIWRDYDLPDNWSFESIPADIRNGICCM